MARVDLREDLELQLRLALTRAEQLARAAEERVVRGVRLHGEPQRAQQLGARREPPLAVLLRLLGRADPHRLEHPERHEAHGVRTGLVAVALAHQLEHGAVHLRSFQVRVQRVAHGRDQRVSGRGELGGPVALVLVRGQQLTVGLVVPLEGGDRAQQLREGRHVVGALQQPGAVDRWEAQPAGSRLRRELPAIFRAAAAMPCTTSSACGPRPVTPSPRVGSSQSLASSPARNVSCWVARSWWVSMMVIVVPRDELHGGGVLQDAVVVDHDGRPDAVPVQPGQAHGRAVGEARDPHDHQGVPTIRRTASAPETFRVFMAIANCMDSHAAGSSYAAS